MGWLTPRFDDPDISGNLLYVARHGGPGPWRQFATLMGMRLRRSPQTAKEYFGYALWRPGLDRAARDAYLGPRAIRALNLGLRDRRHPQLDPMIEDKRASLRQFADWGLPAVPVLAVFGGGSGAGYDDSAQDLANISALRGFLAAITTPVFGKPLNASQSRGAVAIDSVDPASGLVRLRDGRDAPLDALADEIARDYPGGFLFQPIMPNAATLAAHLGRATGSLRLVTLLGPDGPEVLYAVQKCPGVDAMHDGPTSGPRAWALVDPLSGVVQRLRLYHDPAGADLTHWQNPDAPFVGMALPHFASAVDMVCRGHAAMPGHGILGWDLFLTDNGPLVSEVNANPVHGVYQQAAQCGIMNPDFARRLRARQAAVGV